MSAHVHHVFKKGFLLGEENLRKVNELLTKKIKERPNLPGPKFTVYRADSYSYKTENIDDIFNETNSEYSKIEGIEISIRKGDEFAFEISFDSNDQEKSANSLHAWGEDRDFIYVLVSDVKSYLADEVFSVRRLPKRTGFLSTVIILMTIPSLLLLSL